MILCNPSFRGIPNSHKIGTLPGVPTPSREGHTQGSSKEIEFRGELWAQPWPFSSVDQRYFSILVFEGNPFKEAAFDTIWRPPMPKGSIGPEIRSLGFLWASMLLKRFVFAARGSGTLTLGSRDA